MELNNRERDRVRDELLVTMARALETLAMMQALHPDAYTCAERSMECAHISGTLRAQSAQSAHLEELISGE